MLGLKLIHVDKMGPCQWFLYCNDVIVSAMASKITGVLTEPFVQAQKISKLRLTGLCKWNTPVTGDFPAQRASNAEIVSIWWRLHKNQFQASSSWWLCWTTWGCTKECGTSVSTSGRMWRHFTGSTDSTWPRGLSRDTLVTSMCHR